MKFCIFCDKALERDTTGGIVKFKCKCTYEIHGTAEDARISGVSAGGENIEMYRILVNNAAHDRVNKQIKKTCPECKLDYMTFIRVGSSESIVFKCKCGYETYA